MGGQRDRTGSSRGTSQDRGSRHGGTEDGTGDVVAGEEGVPPSQVDRGTTGPVFHQNRGTQDSRDVFGIKGSDNLVLYIFHHEKYLCTQCDSQGDTL